MIQVKTITSTLASVIIGLLFIPAYLFSQDTLPKEKIQKGWSFGGVPAIAYNSDKGFMYGLILSTYNFGDGSSYPTYKYAIKGEWSRTTKGNGVNDIFADLRNVLPYNMRLTFMGGYYTNTMLTFYGFNGYDANYSRAYEDDKSADYLSRAYYNLDRKLVRATVDVQGPTMHKNFRWLAGYGIYNFNLKPVDIAKLNKDLDDDKKLPNVPTLYEKYVSAGVISQEEKNGGLVNYVKAGLVFDTRDNEPNPNSGYWIEGAVLGAPKFFGNDKSFGQLTLIYRHYITLWKPRLTFAYRFAYQSNIMGEKPFYMLPYFVSSFKTQEAFGGVKTIRGVLAQRIQGNDVVFGNLEFRYKFMFFNLFKQNFYLSANTFLDGGQVTSKYKFTSNVPLPTLEIDESRESIHLAAGAGIRIVMNQNFIVCVDYGRAFKKQDGISGLYIDLDFLY